MVGLYSRAQEALSIVQHLEVCSCFRESHPCGVARVLPLVWVIYRRKSSVGQLDFSFGGSKSKVKDFQGVVHASPDLFGYVIASIRGVWLRWLLRGGRALSTGGGVAGRSVLLVGVCVFLFRAS